MHIHLTKITVNSSEWMGGWEEWNKELNSHFHSGKSLDNA